MDDNQGEKNIKNQNLYSKMEEEVLNFWQKNEIFRKSVEKNAPKGNYVFNDGPPFITGLPHYATLLPSIAKDVVPRYWTMKGYKVERVWGWDCHGLPVENKVEKELKLKNKKEIEDLGVDKFINACRAYVDKGSEQWEWYIDRIGRWVDMKNAYKTMDLEFMESVIWSFKKLYDDDLIYEDYRTSLHCPHCATPLSKFEITMDDGSYRDVTVESVIVKFKVKNLTKEQQKIGIDKNTYILAWTTTPWTLPGNLALAVGEDIDYLILETKELINENIADDSFRPAPGKYIIAADRYDDLIKEKKYFKNNIKKIKGSDILGLKYEPIYSLNDDEIKISDKTYKVYSGDFVTVENGTGIVHIAPNFGENDFELGKRVGLPIVDIMDENGVYLKSAGEWSGYYFKKINRDILINMKEKDTIFYSFNFTHSYPFCYRCNTALIYKTQKAWYLNIQKIKEKMLETNKKINWVPKYFKNGRFKKNIESAPDWCLSRSRYWGSPIPVWKCSKCKEIKVLGSIEEIEKLSGGKVDDLHRPNIDKYLLKCKCGEKMERVREVLDCWFESGAMPFAQFHYPFERHKDFKNLFPADFIIEYTGQLRGWFYYLHALSNSLFNSVSFKNVIVSGVLAGTDGRKMSKSFGNYPDPRATLDKYGGDALRMYFMTSPIMLGDDTSLSELDIRDVLRKNIIILWNVFKFYELFMPLDSEIEMRMIKKKNILDEWILIKFKKLKKEVTKNLEKYNLPEASRPISEFIDDLSTWYLRRSRERFKSEDEEDKRAVLTTTKFILTELSKLIAPFMPFISEQIWQKITGNNFKNKDRSVHLEKWPEGIFDSILLSKEEKIIEEMDQTRKIVELGLAERAKSKIKVRQPLKTIIAKNCNLKNDFKSLILDELNVKNIICEDGEGDIFVDLDANITFELKMEGIKREIVRHINMVRKDMGLGFNDRTKILYATDSDLVFKSIKTFKKDILKNTLSDEISMNDNIAGLVKIQVNGEPLMINILEK